MSYKINLIRCKSYEDYLEKKFTEITVEEWKTYLTGKENFEYKETFVIPNPLSDSEISISGHFGLTQVDDELLCFSLSSGKVTVPYKEDIRNFIVQIGIELGARCYGDEGEEYELLKDKSKFTFKKLFKR